MPQIHFNGAEVEERIRSVIDRQNNITFSLDTSGIRIAPFTFVPVLWDGPLNSIDGMLIVRSNLCPTRNGFYYWMAVSTSMGTPVLTI